jgi:Icc protein
VNRRKFLKSVAAGVALQGLTSVGEIFIPVAEALGTPKFNFAHITDLHLDVHGESNWQFREKSVTLFIDALRQIGRLPKLDFVVFGGDQIHYGPNDKESLDVFQKWTARLNMPIFILLGNTEVSPVSGVSKLRKDDYLKAWSGKGLRPGHSSWAFDPVSSVRVIGLDVTVDGKPYGEARIEELKWLENELNENKSKKLIIVFTHHLLVPTTAKDTTRVWSFWMVKNSTRVREILEAHPNVRLVISGHHHVSRVETVGRITYVSDPAIVTYPCSFRLYSVSHEGIHLKNIGLDDKAAVARAMELLISDPYAKMYSPDAPQKVAAYSMGLTEQDREITIKL